MTFLFASSLKYKIVNVDAKNCSLLLSYSQVCSFPCSINKHPRSSCNKPGTTDHFTNAASDRLLPLTERPFFQNCCAHSESRDDHFATISLMQKLPQSESENAPSCVIPLWAYQLDWSNLLFVFSMHLFALNDCVVSPFRAKKKKNKVHNR